MLALHNKGYDDGAAARRHRRPKKEEEEGESMRQAGEEMQPEGGASPLHADVLTEFKVEGNCRVCFNIEDWRRRAARAAFGQAADPAARGAAAAAAAAPPASRQECPLDSEELGRRTWSLLHTMAAYYPEVPSAGEQREMRALFSSLGRFYPCSYCARDLRASLAERPPAVASRASLTAWLCGLHNGVNERLGKEPFDCARLDERWLAGPPGGACE